MGQKSHIWLDFLIKKLFNYPWLYNLLKIEMEKMKKKWWSGKRGNGSKEMKNKEGQTLDQ